ncbi:hypothetical protein E8E14_001165 [Neopestalotiopsis sp. 37M]|nr:hypothetical protein E8E14_001165 [Neopestalotiopsis sp. 37M]
MPSTANGHGADKPGKRDRLSAFFTRHLRSPSRERDDATSRRSQEEGGSPSRTAPTENLTPEPDDKAHLWDEAWASIQSDKPQLVARYQKYLLSQCDATMEDENELNELSGKDKKERLLKGADLKVAVAQAKLSDGSLDSQVKRIAEGIVNLLIRGKDLVTALASQEPHAALAWTGCCVILPLLLNPSAERTAALDGFADVARILCRYNVVEADLCSDTRITTLSGPEILQLQAQLRRYLIKLYAMIIEFQIRLILRYDRTAVLRFLRDTIKTDDWKPLVKNIKELEESNLRDINVCLSQSLLTIETDRVIAKAIGQHVLQHVQYAIECQGQQIAVGFAEMTKNFEIVQAGIENLRLESNNHQGTTKTRDILNAFKPEIDYVWQKDRNNVCTPDTGHWFFHHPEYEAFQGSIGPQLLFVTAEAGGGKSTTMRTLIDNTKKTNEASLVAYFFFKDDNEKLRSYDDALSTILYQFFTQERGFIQLAKEAYRKYGNAIRHHTREMWQILVTIASKAERIVLCVLDALDECAQADRQQLIADLADVFHNTTQPTCQLRLIASSRPYQDENHAYAHLFTVRNTRRLPGEDAEVQYDIFEVIRSQARELCQKRQLDQNVENMLVEKLSQQNNNTRSFLAVRMAFELLDSHGRMHKGAGERTIRIILADIPTRLGDQFDKMLERSHDSEHAWKLFCVILAARKRITVPEFKVIYCLTEATSSTIEGVYSYEDLELPTNDEEFKKLVRSRCGLFITFLRNSVHLFHQTAREHLMAKQEMMIQRISPSHTLRPLKKNKDILDIEPSHPKSWKGCISSEDANLVCAKVCLDILTFRVSRDWVFEMIENIEWYSTSEKMSEFLSRERPLCEYAAFNWHEHVALGGQKALEAIQFARYAAVLDLSNTAFWVWFLPILQSDKHPKWVDHESLLRSYTCTYEGRDLDDIRQESASFLRKGYLENLFPMDKNVHALFQDTMSTLDLKLAFADGPLWRADCGYDLIDAFHLRCEQYHMLSATQIVKALDAGDKPRELVLRANISPSVSTLIWTCIAYGAPNALRMTLAFKTTHIEAGF